MPIVYPHLALMPDAHLGKGATVGSVIPTLGAIIPAAVGVDIGCGMIAVRTPVSVAEVRSPGRSAPLRGDIERAIPLSAGKYNQRSPLSARPRVAALERARRGARRPRAAGGRRRDPELDAAARFASARATTSSR